MSIKVMSAVWELTTVRGAKLLVLLALADHAKDNGICWPSVSKLAKKARLSHRHTRRILGELQEDGLLVKDEQTGPRGANTYKVQTPDRMSPGSLVPLTNATPPRTSVTSTPDTAVSAEPSVEPSLVEPSSGSDPSTEEDEETKKLEARMGIK